MNAQQRTEIQTALATLLGNTLSLAQGIQASKKGIIESQTQLEESAFKTAHVISASCLHADAGWVSKGANLINGLFEAKQPTLAKNVIRHFDRFVRNGLLEIAPGKEYQFGKLRGGEYIYPPEFEVSYERAIEIQETVYNALQAGKVELDKQLKTAKTSSKESREARAKLEHENLLKDRENKGRSDMRNELDKVHSKELDNLNAAHKAELDSLNAAHKAELDSLNAAHKAELDSLYATISALQERINTLLNNPVAIPVGKNKGKAKLA